MATQTQKFKAQPPQTVYAEFTCVKCGESFLKKVDCHITYRRQGNIIVEFICNNDQPTCILIIIIIIYIYIYMLLYIN